MKLLFAAVFVCSSLYAQTFRGRIGIQIEGGEEGSRSRAFVDLGRVFRPWSPITGSGTVPVDADGWPLGDASALIFDIRPAYAWAPPIDDPAKFQPDWSGTYHLSFRGQATVSASDQVTVANVRWDRETNITTGDVVVPRGTGLLGLTFADTIRTPGGAKHTGITGLKVIRPGYPAGTGQVFTREFLDALAPFAVLRFMGFTATNDADSKPYPQVTNWADRRLVSDATQQATGGKTGAAWEYVIQLANQSGKDIWINIPVSATEDYIRQLALLLRSRLNAGLRIYIEHSNEVWNQLFPQYAWNSRAAQAEGLTNLQRHAKRLVTISNIFGDVFGNGAVNDRVRVILAWWTIRPAEYDAALQWIQAKYGEPSQFLYGVAQTHYYNDEHAAATADVDGVIAAMRADSDSGTTYTKQMAAIAARYNLKLTVYEGGPDNGGGSTTNIANRILANRSPAMGDLVVHDARDNWFALGGDLFMYFTLSGAYSRHGSWGAVEDIVNLNTPKYNALLNLIGPPAKAAAIDTISDSASGVAAIAPGGFLSIYGKNFTSIQSSWGEAILDGLTLPEELGGVRVRIAERDAHISYVDSTQINAVAPPGIASGPVAVEVITNNGSAAQQADAEAVSPGFYGYTLQGVFYPWALVATESTALYVAQKNAFGPSYPSRPARPGDILEVFANGLGGLGADFPVGQILRSAYAIDATAVQVTIDGLSARVGYAGAIAPGLYQVNVTVPALEHRGDVPIAMTVNGKAAQADAKLVVE